MKKFIVSILLVLFGVCIIDLSVGIVGKTFRKKLPDSGGGPIVKINYISTRLESDIVIYGASTASHNYICSQIKNRIDSALNVNYSIYNSGIDGHFIQYQCCWIEMLLERRLPKIIIWDLRDWLLCDKRNVNDLAPYYDDYDVVRKYFTDLDYKEQIKVMFNLYRYNESFIKYIYGILTENKINDGYVPLDRVMTKEQAFLEYNKEYNRTNLKMEPVLKNEFKRVISICKQNNIKLFVVCSPSYGDKTRNPYLTDICKTEKVPFIDFASSDYYNQHYEFFQDKGHLNKYGAEIFTNMVIEKMLPYL